MNKNLNYKKYPLKINLTIWYMVILFLVLIFFSSILYFYLESQLSEEVKSILEIEMQQLKSEINETGLNSDYLLNSVDRENLTTFVYNSQGKLMNKNLESEFIQDIITEVNKKNNFFKIIEYNNQKWAVLSSTVNSAPDQDFTQNYHINLVYSFAREQKMLDNLILILLIMIPLTLILASGGGYFLASRALKAIDLISVTAAKISQSNLSQRIKINKGREDEIGRLVKTLNSLLDRLENSFYRQKQFNADVSHELKTPISVIKAQIEEAIDSEKKLTSDQKNILLTIKKQIEQMNQLVSQMLLLAKVDGKNIKPDKEEFDLNVVVDAVIEEMNNLASEKNISIKKEIREGQEFRMKADLSLITQLLLNLIDNALKYSKDSGKIKIILTKLDGFYRLNIIDNGIGIAEEDLDDIFKRFYRVDKSRSREYGGTGLGLSICSWIVKIHGGEINIKSSLKKGSNFEILLPEE
ncbi:sensor histidine kinase [Halanaerobium congolense]|jgi:heavy metal sensor kinase|uniref:histidine kinase n=1 Tax=Halanaerobium congolense TaxID=54121 RepID=A0A1G6HND7_9FIRM|nr:HAMP domain-containing sensor histidine kinase [Halanaerobium congolense]PXV69976.1 heavy metal sensor kinase [Halanaerobium congolense]TDP26943.1 heavy metal sensor kinase [Halanaerobium congolense]TDS33090.1 heavy metal sensor kinase [Halanaerobium congolense]SDB95405.1 heavy metal sensor kinase [Halanaerobium congolense]SDH66210.1 heavy metal sensor kinase [Halanaerobium congolense]